MNTNEDAGIKLVVSYFTNMIMVFLVQGMAILFFYSHEPSSLYLIVYISFLIPFIAVVLEDQTQGRWTPGIIVRFNESLFGFFLFIYLLLPIGVIVLSYGIQIFS